jgi:hypothetical protein
VDAAERTLRESQHYCTVTLRAHAAELRLLTREEQRAALRKLLADGQKQHLSNLLDALSLPSSFVFDGSNGDAAGIIQMETKRSQLNSNKENSHG